MHIKPNRQSKSYVGTYNTQDPIDMLMFEHLKKNVSLLNLSQVSSSTLKISKLFELFMCLKKKEPDLYASKYTEV